MVRMQVYACMQVKLASGLCVCACACTCACACACVHSDLYCVFQVGNRI